MGKLIYSMIVSLDGYVADADGNFASWAQPTEEALSSLNDAMTNVSTYLYGRKMYGMMAVWETDPELAASSPESARFARGWQANQKIVYSQTLGTTHTARTQLLRAFDPEHVRGLKRSSDHDFTVDGPTLAAEAFRHGLVDRVMILLCPVTVGAGLAFWPPRQLDMSLQRVQQFDDGVVFLSYDINHPQNGLRG